MLVPTIGFIALSRITGLVSELRVGCTALFSVYQSVLATVNFHCLLLSETHRLKLKKFTSCILSNGGTDESPFIITK